LASNSDDIVIRRAADADVPAIRSIAAAAYQPYSARIGRAPAPANADYAAAVGKGQAFVAVIDGCTVGLIVLVPQQECLLLENVAVLPSLQGRGIGTRLLEFAEFRATEFGLTEIRLYTNVAMTENLAYYPRRGYVETHRAEEDGYRRVYFTKRLC
jgi:GNAT superfamily N-acetyltransferase